MDKTPFQALLDQVPEEAKDVLTDEVINLETQLNIHDLFLLLRVAVWDGVSPWEPIDMQMLERDDAGNFTAVQRPMSMVVGLSEQTLRELAGQAQLLKLGLLELREDAEYGWQLMLTPQGAQAVAWWSDFLAAELGFQLPKELLTTA